MLILFYHIHGNETISVTYTPILSSRPRIWRICPGASVSVSLIVRRIAAYAWPQFGMSLKHQINLILIMCFIIYNVTVNVNFNRILASRLRCCRLSPVVGIQRTLIITHIVTYAWPQFEISLTHEISLIVLILFYHMQGNETLRVTNTPILASRPRSRRLCPRVSLYIT